MTPRRRFRCLIRGPGIPRGRTTKALVGDVDLAPTIMDATPARASRPLDGRSILPFARDVNLRSLRPFLHTTAGQGAKGRTNTREGGTRGTQPRVPAWSAVRTTRWLYVEYRSGQREMYDLKRDHWQNNNLIDDPTLRHPDPQKHAATISSATSSAAADGPATTLPPRRCARESYGSGSSGGATKTGGVTAAPLQSPGRF